jgi:hypothetical protein
MVKEMFAEAGINGKTNHSLRVAGTTSLFNAGVPKRIIQGRTGHSSLEGLRKYERVTENEEVAISKVLTCEKDSFQDSKSTAPQSSPSSLPLPSGVNYNNCTINVNYSASPSFGPGFTNNVPLQPPYNPNEYIYPWNMY